jgi:hypothetical protein
MSTLRQLNIEFVNNQELTYQKSIPNLLIKNTKQVTLYDKLSLEDGKTIVELEIKIETDLQLIPKKYHESFINMITTKYFGKVYISNNNVSSIEPIEKQSWLQKVWLQFFKLD